MYGFGERLKRLRTERGLTQKQLGEQLGVKNSIVSFYEVGDRQPSLDIIIQVSRIFGVTADYLLGISKDRGGIPTEGLKDDEIAALVHISDLMRRRRS